MKNVRNFRAMLIVGGGLTAAIAMPGAAVASCGAFSPRQESPSAFEYESPETAEQRVARLAEQKAKREARKAANLAKKAARQQTAAEKAAAAQSTAVASN
jgi:membrane protein involved in colicin uptake